MIEIHAMIEEWDAFITDELIDAAETVLDKCFIATGSHHERYYEASFFFFRDVAPLYSQVSE